MQGSKLGTHWQQDELDVIVSSYFEMLSAELSQQPYTKSRHTALVMERIGRSHRAVEFKNQNISAVLDELGMPWIPGYKPKVNYQNAIFDAIDRYLSAHPAITEPPIPATVTSTSVYELFVAPPTPANSNKPTPERLRQLVAKFDPVARDHRNRTLGKAGEAFVVELERRWLTESNRPDLAARVLWTADEEGDGAGFDIFSYTTEGRESLIEVKTTNGSARTPFFLSKNEYKIAKQNPDIWSIYRVHLFANGPRVFKIAPPLETNLRLTTETWRASF